MRRENGRRGAAYSGAVAASGRAQARIAMKITSNFSCIRMMNGGCAYQKIAFS
jgi:hypothetical protein